jgi:transcriptional regulator with GAF, ATPase, and Fis domain
MLEITSDTLVPPRSDNSDECESLRLEDIEKQHIVSVLRKTDWVIDGPRGAALILNLHPNTLRSRMKKLGISRGG